MDNREIDNLLDNSYFKNRLDSLVVKNAIKTTLAICAIGGISLGILIGSINIKMNKLDNSVIELSHAVIKFSTIIEYVINNKMKK